MAPDVEFLKWVILVLVVLLLLVTTAFLLVAKALADTVEGIINAVLR